jgi:hypothetical protein
MDEIILDENIRTESQEWSWTDLNKKRAYDLLIIIKDVLGDYHPVTVRQVYYQLISSLFIEKDHWYKNGNPTKGYPKDLYQAVVNLLKWMRLHNYVPWSIINDEHRITGENPGWDDAETFLDEIKNGIQNMTENYQRCTSQNQENYIEVWLEKAALQHIVKLITDKYCKRLIVNRGYISMTFLNNYRQRAGQAVKAGQQPVVLYYGDWDPSGVNMIYAGYQTLVDDMEFDNVQFYRGAINPDQFHLIKASPVPIKAKDKRSKKFIEKYGTMAFELDAFHPRQLEEIIEQDILALTNIETLNCEIGLGEKERKRLERLPGIIEKVFENYMSEGMVRTRYKP